MITSFNSQQTSNNRSKKYFWDSISNRNIDYGWIGSLLELLNSNNQFKRLRFNRISTWISQIPNSNISCSPLVLRNTFWISSKLQIRKQIKPIHLRITAIIIQILNHCLSPHLRNNYLNRQLETVIIIIIILIRMIFHRIILKLNLDLKSRFSRSSNNSCCHLEVTIVHSLQYHNSKWSATPISSSRRGNPKLLFLMVNFSQLNMRLLPCCRWRKTCRLHSKHASTNAIIYVMFRKTLSSFAVKLL